MNDEHVQIVIVNHARKWDKSAAREAKDEEKDGTFMQCGARSG